jgi:hypothetical protein
MQEVVDAARDEASPLHDQFTWNVGEAAKKHWLHEARLLVHEIEIQLLDPESEDEGFVPVIISPLGSGGYRETRVALADPEDRQAILMRALQEAETWAKKHRKLTELAPIRDAIQRVSVEVNGLTAPV